MKGDGGWGDGGMGRQGDGVRSQLLPKAGHREILKSNTPDSGIAKTHQ